MLTQKNLEAEFGVKMTDEDTAFYKDNCMGSYTAICNATVSSSWMRNKKRKLSRTVSAERHSREMKESEREESVAKRLQYEEALDQFDTSVATDVDPNFNQTPTCTIFNNPTETYITTRSKSSRATVTSDEPIPQQDNSLFRRVKVRHSRKSIDENIMRCTVQWLADYKVSPGDLVGIIIHTANIILGQNWEQDNVDLDDEYVISSDRETNSDSNDDGPEPDRPDIASTSKWQRSRIYLTYVFPVDEQSTAT